MSRAYGSSATLLLKRESAYGTSPSGNYIRMPFNSCTLGSEQGLIDDSVLGQGRDPLAPLLDVINDEGDIVVPVDPRYLGYWLTGLFGDPVSTALSATGYIDFTANPSDLDIITLNGTTWTFVAVAPTGNQTQIMATATQTMDQLVADLGASADVNIVDSIYSRPTTTQRLLITHGVAGAVGNAFTLAASVATASGPVQLAHTGGVIGVDTLTARSVNPMVFNNAPRFHSGGVVVARFRSLPSAVRLCSPQVR